MLHSRTPVVLLVSLIATCVAAPSALATTRTGKPDHKAAKRFRVGDHVRCKWKAGPTEYSGRIDEISGGMLFVRYDDGDEEWITPKLCRLPDKASRTGEPDPGAARWYRVGDRVKCLWKAGTTEYDGRVGEISGGMLFVDYVDGGKEWITPSLCRLGKKSSAKGTGTPDHEAARRFAVGSRVRCRWKAGKVEYAGSVGKISGGMLFVNYDDGSKELITPKLCRTDSSTSSVVRTGAPDFEAARRFAAGDRVRCRWQAGKTEFSGRIREISEGMLFIQYDDGDKEWITPKLCRPGSGATGTGKPDFKAAKKFRVGDRVRCRWKAGPTEFAGRVGEISAGMLYVDYDDGDKEWISPALCRRTK